MQFDVWIEGYRATGEESTARYLGAYEADNFRQACINAMTEKGWDTKHYNKINNTYWGCRFFDNEPAAREVFG